MPAGKCFGARTQNPIELAAPDNGLEVLTQHVHPRVEVDEGVGENIPVTKLRGRARTEQPLVELDHNPPRLHRRRQLGWAARNPPGDDGLARPGTDSVRQVDINHPRCDQRSPDHGPHLHGKTREGEKVLLVRMLVHGVLLSIASRDNDKEGQWLGLERVVRRSRWIWTGDREPPVMKFCRGEPILDIILRGSLSGY
jgi:hypothetical protein